MASNGLRNNLIPGTEVFSVGGEGSVTFLGRVSETIKEQGHPKLRVKLGDTASGMCTVVLDKQQFDTDKEYRMGILKQIRSFTTQEPGNIVIEQELELEDGWVDYGTRGYITKDGGFYPLSIAMQITDSNGVYRGAVVTVPENGRWIGLSEPETSEMMETTQQLSAAVYEEEYVGPVNPDMFRRDPGSSNNGKVSPSLHHDFNFRDGGTSASANIAGVVFESQTVIDLDLSLESERELTLDELNAMVTDNWSDRQILIYSTTFLRHPKLSGDGKYVYTVKTMAEPTSPVTNVTRRDEEISGILEKMNSDNYGEFSFVLE